MTAGRWRPPTAPATAAAVIVATGYSRTPYLPDWPGRATYPGPLLHSSDYREPSPYAGQHVLVVGAGNSAAEIAVDLVGVAARVELSVRTPPNIVRRDTLGVPSQLLGHRAEADARARDEPAVDGAAQGQRPEPGGATGCPRRRATASRSSCAAAPCRSSTTASSGRSATGRITVVPTVERFDGAERRARRRLVDPPGRGHRGDRLPARARSRWSVTSTCSTTAACRGCTGRRRCRGAAAVLRRHQAGARRTAPRDRPRGTRRRLRAARRGARLRPKTSPGAGRDAEAGCRPPRDLSWDLTPDVGAKHDVVDPAPAHRRRNRW